MPKIDNVKIYGLNESIKRAKFPMAIDTDKLNEELTPGIKSCANCKIGEGHDNFLVGIIVQFDLTFSNKAWVEMQRYHHIDIISSQSSIHRLMKFDIEHQCNPYVDKRIVAILKDYIDTYNNMIAHKNSFTNEEIQAAKVKALYNIPSGFELTAGMTTNYRQLKTIYHQRRNHILPDWQMFCDWCETLPMFKELCIPESK